MSPVVGVSAPNSSRMNVDLPEPDGPMRKTNSPLSILTLTSSNAGRADALYFLLTWSRVIITARQCSREFRGPATISSSAAPAWAPDRVPAGAKASGLCWGCRTAGMHGSVGNTNGGGVVVVVVTGGGGGGAVVVGVGVGVYVSAGGCCTRLRGTQV